MRTYTVDGAVDPVALRAELAAALGSESSATWWIVATPQRACVTSTDALGDAAQQIMNAHVAPQGAEQRAAKAHQSAALAASGAAREERKLRRLMKVDPLKALLIKGGLA